jgi:hypothetical protein
MPLDPTTRGAAEPSASAATEPEHERTPAAAERGGPLGPEPTRYGDWERRGRCIDF